LNSTAYVLRIAPDQLQASLHPAGSEDEQVTLDCGQDLRDLLAHKGIVHGLDLKVVEKAAACLDRGEPLPEPLILATGTPPLVGSSGLRPRHTPHPQQIEETDEEGQTRETTLLLTPLVRRGELLTELSPSLQPQNGINIFGQTVSFPQPAAYALVSGENVRVNEEGQLVATVSGYPVTTTSRKGSVEQMLLSIDRAIHISPDRMQALLHLKPPPPDHVPPDLETLLHILDEEEVVFGRLPHAIEQCLERCTGEQRPQTAVVALGTLPVKGKDAWLRFEMEVGSLPGKVMGNGEIDFRERNMFIGVNKDQLIAKKIPLSAGVPGKDIFGTTIEPLAGKDIAIRAMDDAALDEATGEIRALRSGVLSMVTENSVKVCSRQVVSQDVGYTTGNIVSRDAVEIKGSIKPKFRVNALGDILVTGDVEKAQVRSDSSVVIKGGLVGKMATVHARGDVDVHFVVQGRIFCGKTLLLRQHASYCRLHSSGDLHCNPTSRVLTSQLVAFNSLTAGNVGSDIAAPSLLAAAVAPDQLQRFFELRRNLAAQEEAVETLRRHIGASAESEELDELLDDYNESRRQLAHFNLIVPHEQNVGDQGLSHAMACSIVVKGKVVAGTEIRIGNSQMILPTTMSNVCFRLQDQGADKPAGRNILIIPNKK